MYEEKGLQVEAKVALSRYSVSIISLLDTLFETATRPRGKVLVHLEGNDDRTRVKCNHQSCLRHVGLPYFVVKGWVTRGLFIHQPVVFCFVLSPALGFYS
jgi:hypothetical protein